MNLEGLTLSILTKELASEVLGGKIFRVFMPKNNAVLLHIKRERDTIYLLADMNGASPALYVPKKAPENPELPPAFCMLLRKHLEEGRITHIEQLDLDRVITLDIDMLGERSKIITKQLVFELAGKNSNIILVQDGIIIDALRHIGVNQNSYRVVLPGKEYIAPPPQDGLSILAACPEEIVQRANASSTINFSKALMSATTGIGKVTTSELMKIANIPESAAKLDDADANILREVISGLQDKIKNAPYPVYAVIGRTNQVKTILTLEPQVLDAGARVQSFDSVNDAICFAQGLVPIELPEHEILKKLVANETIRLKKKLKALAKDLEHADDADKEREKADSLMASIYLLKKGMTKVRITNIYDGSELELALNPILSPTENAQSYYKKYNKFKRAQTEVRVQTQQTEDALSYVESIDASLSTAMTKNEVEEIRQEIIASGILKEVGKKKKSSLPQSQPLKITLPSGTLLFVGKNNKQNDYVTFTLAGPRDLWFHTKDIPGSHVILKANGSVSEEDIAAAVEAAAHFSKAAQGSNVPIDCVERRFVKKPAGAKPGFVIFTNQKTYYVTPRENFGELFLK
ncbi:MAG: NFACT family protein [Phascolarctobacterium sp.]|nr:NFACT family protein [Phascolarctobacterium sp.]